MKDIKKNNKKKIEKPIKKHFFSIIDNKKIFYYAWEVKKPRLIVHIVHGVFEYGLRFDEFARFLNKNRISVYAMDLRGHGETGRDFYMGYFSDDNGSELILNDIRQLNKIITDETNVSRNKIVLLGNSVGSFIVRTYLTKFKDVKKVVLVGTCHPPVCITRLISFLSKANTITITKARRPNRFLQKFIFWVLNLKFWREGKLAFISRDEDEIHSLINHTEYSFSNLTNKAFYDISFWLKEMVNKKQGERIDKSTEILLINGEADSLSRFGKGVLKAFRFYRRKLNLEVRWIQCFNMRHDIIHDLGKTKVYYDILQFLLEKK